MYSTILDLFSNISIAGDSSKSLQDVLKPLLLKLACRPSTKLMVDPSDLVSEGVAFYKSPNFEPFQPIKITYIGQPALDSGGVKRQFYTDVFNEMATNNEFKLFEGLPNRLLFNYNQTALSCGLFKMFGQMISHSVCQGCAGFPFLAPSMYYYVATADINQAAAYASVCDIFDDHELSYVKKVNISIL